MKNNVEIEGFGGTKLNTGVDDSIDPVTIEAIARAIYGQDKLNLEGLKAILDIIPSGIAIIGIDFKFLFVNKRGMELYGFNYIGWDFREHVDRVKVSGLDGTPRTFAETSVGCTLLSREIVRNREAVIQRADGSQIFVLCGSAPIFDERGQVIAAILSFDDITERKHYAANQAFKIKIGERLVEFTNVGETMAILCCEICEYFKASQCIFSEIDENQEFVTVNYEWRRTSIPSLKGVHSINNFLFRDFSSAFYPEGTYIVEDVAKDVGVNAEQMALFSIDSLVNILPVQKDGCRFSMSIFDNSPRRWRKDEIRLMRGLTTSIWMYLTRACSRNALAESQAQLEAELEATKLLQSVSTELLGKNDIRVLYEKITEVASRVMKADSASLRIFCPEHGNHGQLKLVAYYNDNSQGIKSLEWVNVSLNTICGNAFRKEQRIIISDVNKYEHIKCTETPEILLQAGIYAMQTTPLVSRSGRPLGTFSTHWCNPYQPSEHELLILDVLARQAADLIEHKMNEEDLRKSKKTALNLVKKLRREDENKNTFISMLSHELRNPLTTVMMSLNLLDKTLTEDEHTTKMLGIAKRQTEQLVHLIDDLLDVTRINQNKIKLKKEIIELNELAKETALDFQLQFAGKDVKLEIESVPSIYLKADPIRLAQIIDNLLHNALKFTSKGDLVTVTLSRDMNTNEAVIVVQDTGQGIDPERLGGLFEPFSLSDKSLDRGYGGLGIGLSIVKGMAELHEGSVQAFSEGKGKGARFTIRLPLSKEKIEKQECRGKIDSVPNTSLKVLVIEDNDDLAGIMCKLINSIGHKTMVVYNGTQGIIKAREIKPDVIICDIGLPDISGHEVAKAIRKDSVLQDTFLIALSGYAQPEDMEYSKQAGFDLHLAKPVSISVLQQVLNSVT